MESEAIKLLREARVWLDEGGAVYLVERIDALLAQWNATPQPSTANDCIAPSQEGVRQGEVASAAPDSREGKKHPDCEDCCQILEHKGYHTCSQTGRCEMFEAMTPAESSSPDKLRSNAKFLLDCYKDLSEAEAKAIANKLTEAAAALSLREKREGIDMPFSGSMERKI